MRFIYDNQVRSRDRIKGHKQVVKWAQGNNREVRG